MHRRTFLTHVGVGVVTAPILMSPVKPSIASSTVSDKGVLRETRVEARYVIPPKSKKGFEGISIDHVIGEADRRTWIDWKTDNPYESVIDLSPGAEAIIRNCDITHFSKSVASNAAIYVREGASLVLENCTITSSSGAGLLVEGGFVTLRNTVIYDCKGNGILATSSLDGTLAGVVELYNCKIDKNGGTGLFARDFATIALDNTTTVDGNRGGDFEQKGFGSDIARRL